MTNVIRFWGRLRSPPDGSSQSPYVATVIPFPYSRRRGLVEEHARAVRGLPTAEIEDYLEEVLEGVCEELRTLGIDCDDCQNAAINEFAEAIGKQLHGPTFRLDLGEVAN